MTHISIHMFALSSDCVDYNMIVLIDRFDDVDIDQRLMSRCGAFDVDNSRL